MDNSVLDLHGSTVSSESFVVIDELISALIHFEKFVKPDLPFNDFSLGFEKLVLEARCLSCTFPYCSQLLFQALDSCFQHPIHPVCSSVLDALQQFVDPF